MARIQFTLIGLLFFIPSGSGQSPRRVAVEATPANAIRIKDGFHVELLYSVPRDQQGSWVCMCTDPKGRLIVSDQYGGLFRVTPPAVGKSEPTQVEKIPIDLGEAQGLVWAFDSLYVVVNHAEKYQSGLYRVRDTDNDDQLDSIELLRKFDGEGEHGPHAVVLGPDQKSLYLVIGNHTKLTDINKSRVPRLWQEDIVVPRLWDPRGHAVGVLAPGGHILKTDPDGKEWELFSIGYRNCYDAAFAPDGELFTFDADMEWDMHTPWYRPTRVCHVTSGSEFGWRSGSGKWPTYYPDSLPPVVDIGPGSPTGVTFGTNAKFSAKYQKALFVCDWSFGKLFAVHLTPDGATFKGEFEEFLGGTPLPMTDIVINPVDGAMYFAIGGRKTTSGLYRVTYVGDENAQPLNPQSFKITPDSKTRQMLEYAHGTSPQATVDAAWGFLGDKDRFIQFAARTSVEHCDIHQWRSRALKETDRRTALPALLALVRSGEKSWPDLQKALAQFDGVELTDRQQLDLLRIYQLAFIRMPGVDHKAIVQRFGPLFPKQSKEINAELGKLLCQIDPDFPTKDIPLLTSAPTQEEQMDYANMLRCAKDGWTPDLRRQYIAWFNKAAGYRGGASFSGFVSAIKTAAVANLTEQEREALKDLIEAKPATTSAPPVPRPFVRKWTMAEALAAVEPSMTNCNFDRGKSLFTATQCAVCHQFNGEGGAHGPDLSALAGRFNLRDLVESLIEPNKVISDQYAAVNIVTTAGTVVHGRVVNHTGDELIIGKDMLDPAAIVRVDRKTIESMEKSKISMMPEGLIDSCNADELCDLLAYLLSKGDRKHAMFKK